MAPYLAHWQGRARCDTEARSAAVARARAAVSDAARILLDHGARRIWLVGSLPRGTFQPSSDLDFMTEGMDEAGARAATRLAADRTGLWVDVLRREGMDPDWRRHHERFGELIHG